MKRAASPLSSTSRSLPTPIPHSACSRLIATSASRSTKIGAAGQIAPRRALFVKGKYYLEIAANPEGDHSAALREWTAALEKIVEGSVDPPAALSWFPKEKQQSLRLVPESVLGIRALKRGYLGQYEFGKAFVVLEDSPESAAAVMQKLKTRFADATPAQIGDEALQVTDRYLGRVCMFRKGPLYRRVRQCRRRKRSRSVGQQLGWRFEVKSPSGAFAAAVSVFSTSISSA